MIERYISFGEVDGQEALKKLNRYFSLQEEPEEEIYCKSTALASETGQGWEKDGKTKGRTRPFK